MAKRILIDEDPAAEYINMSVPFLQAGRSKGLIGKGTPTPPFYKLGRLVKYDVADLDAWLAARRVDPADRRAAAPRTKKTVAAAA